MTNTITQNSQHHMNQTRTMTTTDKASPSGNTSTCPTPLYRLLDKIGFVPLRSLADTLQGQIWSVMDKQSRKAYAMKVASKKLHTEKITRSLCNNQATTATVTVLEDIVNEAETLRYLTSTSSTECVPPCPSIIGYRGFFESNKNYYLLMEDGGECLFDFVVRAHGLLSVHKLDIQEWTQVVRGIFKQIIDALDFLHTHQVTHNDVSLENLTLCREIDISIKNVGQSDEHIVFTNKHDIKAKLIDFGLAQRFNVDIDAKCSAKQTSFTSTKFCGKRNYQSPEVVRRSPFNAAANDVWCAGVCLFMMFAGSGPWEVANECDAAYKLVTRGHIRALLQHWQKLKYFDDNLLDLLTSIFQPESKRISLADIKQHPWLQY